MLGKEIDLAAASARLRVSRAEYDARDARMQHRARTHGTRFERHKKVCAGKAIVAHALRRGSHRLDFSVGGRIVTRNRRIVSFTDDLAVEYDDRTYRNLSKRPAFPGNAQCTTHVMFIVDQVGNVHFNLRVARSIIPTRW